MDPSRKSKLIRAVKGRLVAEFPGTAGQIFVFETGATAPPKIAVKTVEPRGKRSTFEALERFEHEIREWARYRHHPAVLTPFCTEVIDDWPFVVMAYCDWSLFDYIGGRLRRTNQFEGVAMLVQVLDALEYARKRGLSAHQDLKPQNILLQDLRRKVRGLPVDYPLPLRPQVADFGLANAYKDLGIRSGSRPYLAPEQYAEVGDLGGSDVFACGVLLCELLSGKHPIGTVTSEVWPEPWRHNGPWKRWARSNRKIAAELVDAVGLYAPLIESCLALDPSARPSLSAMKQALLEILRNAGTDTYGNLSLVLDSFKQDCAESEGSGESEERYQEARVRELLNRHAH